ncbi:TRAP transporter large permease [Natronomonas halophila]|uniref:TRAP transporter large permease n=1 Tax=Natronomonas halophila TaxID=2747817 RepID=UPI0015B43A34|nr:TRAP transporter large permease [Natronomonas halophila]QLD86138.1 TRAP transporter large permease [Natronomonas halophila]
MIEVLVLTFLFLGVLLLLYAMGVPVAIAMAGTSIVIMVSPFGRGLNYSLISTQLVYSLNSFTLLALPFYILLGRIMNRIGLTEVIFDFANALFAQFRGGLAYVNITASMIFSGMSGLALADAAGLGRIEYESMRERGYNKKLALGVTGSSTVIGPIIPPSVTLIIYGVLAGVSIGDLFIAGVIPGLLLGIILMVFTFIIMRRDGIDLREEFDLSKVIANLKLALLPLFLPVLIIGGILSGFFTATEAGAVAVTYALLLGVFYGDMSFNDLHEEIQASAIETFSLLFLLGAASLYGTVALQLQLPMMLADLITSITSNPIGIMLLIILLLLFVGMFMETLAAITILVPILVPILDNVGIDLVQFGIIMILTLMIGLLTPPFGVILFVLEKVTDASLEEITKAVAPFYVPIMIVILLLVAFPALTTWLPSVF